MSVYDGETWSLTKSQDANQIAAAMCSTDFDQLRIRDADGRSIGTMMLVYGNDRDVIADYSANDCAPFQTLMDDLYAYIERELH